MLTCHSSIASLHLQLRHHTLHVSSTTTTLHICSAVNSNYHHHQQPQNPENDNPLAAASGGALDPNPRKHNYKSATILQTQKPQEPQAPLSPQEKAKILELALVRKRTPQFPGSIFVQSPGDADVTSSLPPLNTLFRDKPDGEDDVDEDMLLRAVEIRRKVTAEILKEALMKNGKFGITYATNLVRCLPDFIDYIMIEAAAMKRMPEFSDSSFNFRARTVIEDSDVVRLVRWLKHLAISYTRIAKLICKTKGNLESIRRLADWLRDIHVKGEFVGTVLLRAGDNIFERSNEELDEIVDYLESKGVRREWMGYVISRCAPLLCFTMEELKTRVSFYLDMGMDYKDFGTMVYDCPKALGFLSLEEMREKVNYLKNFDLNDKELGKLLAFKPHLMCCSIEERWKPLIKYFYYLGIPKRGMRKILLVKPMIFCIDLESNIVKKVKFFQDLGVRDEGIGNMIAKFPPLLTYSLEKKIRPVVIFLMTRAGVSQKNIAKVIAMGPELLGCSISQKLEVHMKYYLSLGIRGWQLGEMIADFPMLLRYNLDVIRPKYIYLRRTMVRPLLDIIEFPRFFSYSLEGRIIPRYKIMVENRVTFKLQSMLACSDEQFESKVEDAVKRRLNFESRARESSLSDSQKPDDEALGISQSSESSQSESAISAPHYL
uniref:Embryo defective 2219 n=1 Tax=Erodium texanum TaxID=28960 RepID=A0A0G4AN31_EROTE|nr:embryo defective 2219 [Erodium texanum]